MSQNKETGKRLKFACPIICATLIIASVCSADPNRNEKWFTIDDVGFHIVNAPELKSLSSDQSLEYFSEKPPHLSKSVLSKIKRVSPAKIRGKYKLGKMFSTGDKIIFAEVEKFSHDEVVIKLLQEIGAQRWHHYYYCYRRFLIKREKYIDDIFSLKSMENKFSATYKGVGHGTSMEELKRILGKPDFEYPGQTLQLQEFFYNRPRLYVAIHNFKVYYVKRFIKRPRYIDELWRKN
ncbi:MAG: hypothetical protein ABIE74_03935 [Pseudomonadota bacterium]